jgi:hypothetical protein
MGSLNHLTRKIFFIKLILEYFLGIIGQWQAAPRVLTKACGRGSTSLLPCKCDIPQKNIYWLWGCKGVQGTCLCSHNDVLGFGLYRRNNERWSSLPKTNHRSTVQVCVSARGWWRSTCQPKGWLTISLSACLTVWSCTWLLIFLRPLIYI